MSSFLNQRFGKLITITITITITSLVFWNFLFWNNRTPEHFLPLQLFLREKKCTITILKYYIFF